MMCLAEHRFFTTDTLWDLIVMRKPLDIIGTAEDMIVHAAALPTSKALKTYRRAEELLLSLNSLDPTEEKEQKRVLSECYLMMYPLSDDPDRHDLCELALNSAVASENAIQIAQSRLNLGIELLNSGNLPAAESHFADIITEGMDSDNPEMSIIVGQTLLARVHILRGKSLYTQAIHVADDAAGFLARGANKELLRHVYALMSTLYKDIGQHDKAKEMQEISDSYAVGE